MREGYNGKYKNLYEHLLKGDPVETMTFDDIERVLKAKLPESAYQYAAWWANQDRGQGLAWLKAGYKTAAVTVDERRLTFVRNDVAETGSECSESEASAPKLTIAEAKIRLAATFGVDPSQIEITVRA